MHGLVRSKKMELGRDEDTGGQVLYVVNLAKELGRLKNVDRVELVTRKIDDPDYPGYAQSEEKIGKNASIVRVPCGGPRYIKKVNLWPHIDEYVKNNLTRLKKRGRVPDVLHANYADAGLVCVRMSQTLGTPMVFTGHSLARPKMKRLGVTPKNRDRFESIYHFKKRLSAEQAALDHAAAVVVSSRDEQENQYAGYRIHPKKFVRVAPGVDLQRYHHFHQHRPDVVERRVIQRFKQRMRSLPNRPWVFALSRLDVRKNLSGLVRAFAEDPILRRKANLVFSPGVLSDLTREQERIIGDIRHEISKHQLSKNAWILAEHLSDDEVGALYRLAAKSRGVFVNPAWVEPFGLTTLEAMASGLPVAVTQNGGTRDVVQPNQSGVLFDPYQPNAIASAIKRVLFEKGLWNTLSLNGYRRVRGEYSWSAMAKKELALFEAIRPQKTGV